MSQGAYALGDGWVLGGLALFVAFALLAEGVMWPAERRLQVAVGSPRDDAGDPGGTEARIATPPPWPGRATSSWWCSWQGSSS